MNPDIVRKSAVSPSHTQCVTAPPLGKVALMAGAHCWNATLQQEVATVLAPVRKGPARPPAPATPAARDVGTGPQPSHSASPAGAHTVSPAPRATTARQRECTPPARLHSLAVSPPRAIPASAPFPPKPPSSPPSPPRTKTASLLFPASPSEATPPPAPPPAQSPPRRRSEVHRRVTVSAQQRRSKARMGDRGCRVGIWWPRGEPTWNPAEVHQQRTKAAAARRAAAVGSAALSAGHVHGSPHDGGM